MATIASAYSTATQDEVEQITTPRRVLNPAGRRARPSTLIANQASDFNNYHDHYNTPPPATSFSPSSSPSPPASDQKSPYPPSYRSNGTMDTPPEAYAHSRVDSRPLNELEDLLENWSWGPTGERVSSRSGSISSKTSRSNSLSNSPSLNRSGRQLSEVGSMRRISRLGIATNSGSSSTSPPRALHLGSGHSNNTASTLRAQASITRAKQHPIRNVDTSLQYFHEPNVLVPIGGRRLSNSHAVAVAGPDAVVVGNGRALSTYRSSARRQFSPPPPATSTVPVVATRHEDNEGDQAGHYTDSIYGLY